MLGESFRERVVLVTGATSGIGAAVCTLLAERGATLALHYYSSRQKAADLASTLPTVPTNHLLVEADVSDKAQVDAMVTTVYEAFARIDCLVNIASFSHPALWRAHPVAIAPREWSRTLEVDLTGTFYCSQAVIPIMQAAGRGKIVNFSSAAAHRGDTDTLAYNPAKSGIDGLTKCLARALAPEIQVNAIAPGSIDTGWLETWGLSSEEIENLDALRQGSRRIGRPEEVAELASFLASDRADFITGQIIAIDGGVTI